MSASGAEQTVRAQWPQERTFYDACALERHAARAVWATCERLVVLHQLLQRGAEVRLELSGRQQPLQR